MAQSNQLSAASEKLLAHQPKCRAGACLLVLTGSSLQHIQRPHSLGVGGFRGRSHPNWPSEFSFIPSHPVGIALQHRQIPNNCRHCSHSNDLMPCRLNQRFCPMTIKEACWWWTCRLIGAVGLKDVITVAGTEQELKEVFCASPMILFGRWRLPVKPVGLLEAASNAWNSATINKVPYI